MAYSTRCTMYIVHHVLYNVQCTLYIVHRVLYIVHRIMVNNIIKKLRDLPLNSSRTADIVSISVPMSDGHCPYACMYVRMSARMSAIQETQRSRGQVLTAMSNQLTVSIND